MDCSTLGVLADSSSAPPAWGSDDEPSSRDAGEESVGAWGHSGQQWGNLDEDSQLLIGA